MESFSAENEDEVGFKAGERIHVISKSMDGWWKIRCVHMHAAADLANIYKSNSNCGKLYVDILVFYLISNSKFQIF